MSVLHHWGLPVIGIAIWLLLGYFITRYIVIPTLERIDPSRSASEDDENEEMSTAALGGMIFVEFVVFAVWPGLLAFCTVYWFFWTLFWILGRAAQLIGVK